MSVTHADLMAYADGELTGDARARVEAALAEEPDLQAAVDGHRALRARLSSAYAPVIEEPVPDRLLQAARAPIPERATERATERGADRVGDAVADPPIGSGAGPGADNVVSIGAARARRTSGPWQARTWAQIAAALLVGVIIGRQVLAPDGAIVAAHGALEARGALARALDTQLASDAGAVHIGVTFRTQSGASCRTFATDGGALSGLACKEKDAWRVDVAMRGAARPATQFRTAGAETPPEVLARVEALIAGDPLNATQEKAARDARWAAPR